MELIALTSFFQRWIQSVPALWVPRRIARPMPGVQIYVQVEAQKVQGGREIWQNGRKKKPLYSAKLVVFVGTLASELWALVFLPAKTTLKAATSAEQYLQATVAASF